MSAHRSRRIRCGLSWRLQLEEKLLNWAFVVEGMTFPSDGVVEVARYLLSLYLPIYCMGSSTSACVRVGRTCLRSLQGCFHPLEGLTVRRSLFSIGMEDVKSMARLGRRQGTVSSSRQWGGGTVAVLAVTAMCIVLGYGYLVARRDGPQAAARGTSLSALCDHPSTYFPGNASYRGQAPHPIAVFQQKNQNEPRPTSPVRFDRSHWAGTPFTQNDTKEVQLVACSERARTEKTGKACALTRSQAPLYRATYRVTVMAVASGRQVGEVIVHPQSDACAAYPLVDVRDPRVFSVPSTADYAQALAQFSSRPAQGEELT